MRILRREVVGVDGGRRRAERADRPAVLVRQIGVQIVRQDRGLRFLTDEVKEPLLPLDVNRFSIGAGFDVDEDRTLGGAIRDAHDRVLYALELPAAVGRDKDVRFRGSDAIGISERDAPPTSNPTIVTFRRTHCHPFITGPLSDHFGVLLRRSRSDSVGLTMSQASPIFSHRQMVR